MLRWRVIREFQPRTKNGAPAHSTTGVDSASELQLDQLRIRPLVERNLLGLQRHAAYRAASRTDLPHFRMHRTGVDGALRRVGLGLLRLQEFFRLSREALAATPAAE